MRVANSSSPPAELAAGTGENRQIGSLTHPVQTFERDTLMNDEETLYTLLPITRVD